MKKIIFSPDYVVVDKKSVKFLSKKGLFFASLESQTKEGEMANEVFMKDLVNSKAEKPKVILTTKSLDTPDKIFNAYK